MDWGIKVTMEPCIYVIYDLYEPKRLTSINAFSTRVWISPIFPGGGPMSEFIRIYRKSKHIFLESTFWLLNHID